MCFSMLCSYDNYTKRRDARAVDWGGLENRCPPIGGPRVRIPVSPPIYEPCLALKTTYFQDLTLIRQIPSAQHSMMFLSRWKPNVCQ